MSIEPKIITFYSYKGGVGRTMSLANVAFLAALNKLKVLVMDWDMEAPGLAYYFRGLHDAMEAKKLKNTRGLLDLCWEWSAVASSAQSGKDVNELFDKAGSGTLFRECVRPLISDTLFESPVTLDYISAGSLTIGGEKLQYEDALSKFSWVSFFEDYAGGAMLEHLKQWSKKNYDLVLIDSRTGFADVAGICTMQLPDEVALCFVLNRQNIDGISRVAASIRELREEEVVLRAVPMRVVRGESSEGSDAKARAVNELTKVGGFSNLAVNDDIKNLSVLSYDELPFYETLAPFCASDPTFDPLTLNYARLASNIIGKELQVPPFRAETLALVKNRLLPRHATIDFIETLSQGEPERAVPELHQLMESAYEAVVNEEPLDAEYVHALVEAADRVAELADDSVDSVLIQTDALDLLRVLTSIDSEQWQALLVEKLGEAVEHHGYLTEGDSQLALLEELDILLAGSAANNLRIKRLEYRRRAAWIYAERKDPASAMRTAGEIILLRKAISVEKLAKDQREALLVNDLDMFHIRGEVSLIKGDYSAAKNEFKQGLLFSEQQKTLGSHSVNRVVFNIHLKLTDIPVPYLSAMESAQHALAAVSNGASVQRVVIRFIHLVDTVLRAGNDDRMVVSFCDSLIGNDGKIKTYLANYYGRYPILAIDFFRSVRSLIAIVTRAHDRRKALTICEFFSETASLVVRALIRRRRTVNEKLQSQLDYEFDLLTTLFDRVGVHVERHSSELENRFFMSGARSNSLPDEEA
ncbi:KGGVGR-motif variant AAA ATPase [Pseudomonas viridiflava]|uniref:KGGVGR-motif variant AAA ATPase n=1 Tax=Pseudomonas viridiflava TaxID=33069 RepID=UPI000F03BC3C|nr:AAA family ATPase [Pseudomonas viridiflava]